VLSNEPVVLFQHDTVYYHGVEMMKMKSKVRWEKPTILYASWIHTSSAFFAI